MKFGSLVLMLTLVMVAGFILLAAFDGKLTTKETFFKVFAVVILGFTVYAVSTAFSRPPQK